jgi:hypothetical protein
MQARRIGLTKLAAGVALVACSSEEIDASQPKDAGADSSPAEAASPTPDAAGEAAVDAGAEAALDAASAELIFVGDFEAPGDFELGGTYSQFSSNVDTCEHDQTCTTDSLAIVTSPVRAGARALRITLRKGDTQKTPGTRAEIQTGSHYVTTLDEDFWYGWSIYVPTDWQDGTDQKVVHQWHTGGGNPGGNPIIGLRIDSGKWRITRELTEGTPDPLWEGVAVKRAVWTDWVMHIRWSPSSTGHFTAWMNGELVYSEDAANMHAETGSAAHYQKLGMYGSFVGSVTERVLYYDEVRVAKGPDGFALVSP